MTNRSLVQNKLGEDPTIFEAGFWRSYRVLHFIACRILGGPERAQRAVENCWHTASRRAPRFESEGEFRSWLLRVVIDEVLLLQKDQQSPTLKAPGIPTAAEIFGREAVHSDNNSIRNDDQGSNRTTTPNDRVVPS